MSNWFKGNVLERYKIKTLPPPQLLSPPALSIAVVHHPLNPIAPASQAARSPPLRIRAQKHRNLPKDKIRFSLKSRLTDGAHQRPAHRWNGIHAKAQFAHKEARLPVEPFQI